MSESLARDQLIIDRMETLFESMQILSQRLERVELGLAEQYTRITSLAHDKADKSKANTSSHCDACGSEHTNAYHRPYIWGEK